MQVGIDSFASHLLQNGGEPLTGAEAMEKLLQRIAYADEVGLDVFGIGEHHRIEYLDSATAVILAAAAARTKKIILTSAVTVLSAVDPVRLFQQFATLDLVSQGRAEMIVGRGSSTEAFPLFGFSMNDYDELFEEKLELLLAVRDSEKVTWSGKYRPALTGQGDLPASEAGEAADLDRRRRHAGVVRARRAARVALDGGDHRRRDAPFPAAHRSVQGGGASRRASAGDAAGGSALARLRGADQRGGARRVLPRLRGDVRQACARARRICAEPRGLRRASDAARCAPWSAIPRRSRRRSCGTPRRWAASRA